ncbi:alpha/beta hydrolase family protein, partial [Gregarina niphandrodes]
MSRLIRNIVETVMFPGCEAAHEADDRYFFYLPVLKLGLLVPIWVRPAAHGSFVVIIYAHGNGTDVGMCRRELDQVSRSAGVHIIAFEYPGYGKCSPCQNYRIEEAVDIVAESVLCFVLKELYWPLQNIVFWGCSIGSGILTRLAKKIDGRKLSFQLGKNNLCPSINAANQRTSSATTNFRTIDRCRCFAWDPIGYNRFPRDLGTDEPANKGVCFDIHPGGEIYPKNSFYQEFTDDFEFQICRCVNNHECPAMGPQLGSSGAQLGGLILQCPLLSIRSAASSFVGNVMSRVVIPDTSYNNETSLKRVHTRLLIIHGKQDEMFDWHGSRKMLQEYAGGAKMGVFPPDSDHNNFDLSRDIIGPIIHFLKFYVVPQCHRVSLPTNSSDRSYILYTHPFIEAGPPFPLDIMKQYRPDISDACALRYINGNALTLNVPDVGEHASEVSAAAVATGAADTNADAPTFTRFRRRLRGEPFLPAYLYNSRKVTDQLPCTKPFLWPERLETYIWVAYSKPVRLRGTMAVEPYDYLNSTFNQDGNKVPTVHNVYEVVGHHDMEYRHDFVVRVSEHSIRGALRPDTWPATTHGNIGKCWHLVSRSCDAQEEDAGDIKRLNYFQDRLVYNGAFRGELRQGFLNTLFELFVSPKTNRLSDFITCHQDISHCFVHNKIRVVGSVAHYIHKQRRKLFRDEERSGNGNRAAGTNITRSGKFSKIGHVTTSALRHLVLTAALPCVYLVFRQNTPAMTDPSMADPTMAPVQVAEDGVLKEEALLAMCISGDVELESKLSGIRGPETGQSGQRTLQTSGYNVYGVFINGFLLTCQRQYVDVSSGKVSSAGAGAAPLTIVDATYIPNGTAVFSDRVETNFGLCETLCDLFPFPEYMLVPVFQQAVEARVRTALAGDLVKTFLDFELGAGDNLGDCPAAAAGDSGSGGGSATDSSMVAGLLGGGYRPTESRPHSKFEAYLCRKALWSNRFMNTIDCCITSSWSSDIWYPFMSLSVSDGTRGNSRTGKLVADLDPLVGNNILKIGLVGSVVRDIYDLIGRLFALCPPMIWLFPMAMVPGHHEKTINMLFEALYHVPKYTIPRRVPQNRAEFQILTAQLFKLERDTHVCKILSKCSNQRSVPEDVFYNLLAQFAVKKKLFAKCIQRQVEMEERTDQRNTAAELGVADVDLAWYMFHRVVLWGAMGDGNEYITSPKFPKCEFVSDKRTNYLVKIPSANIKAHNPIEGRLDPVVYEPIRFEDQNYLRHPLYTFSLEFGHPDMDLDLDVGDGNMVPVKFPFTMDRDKLVRCLLRALVDPSSLEMYFGPLDAPAVSTSAVKWMTKLTEAEVQKIADYDQNGAAGVPSDTVEEDSAKRQWKNAVECGLTRRLPIRRRPDESNTAHDFAAKDVAAKDVAAKDVAAKDVAAKDVATATEDGVETAEAYMCALWYPHSPVGYEGLEGKYTGILDAIPSS